ncbi:MAG: SAM-dependent methyltransferase [Candidatus Dojkabacteria bacterium]
MKNFGTLYLIPTSLSKRILKDELRERDLEIVKRLKHFIVETPKSARFALSGMGIVLQELNMQILDEHTRKKDIQTLLTPLVEGFNVGLMSDAGTPGIADPGALLVRECHRVGIEVVPLVGPSSIVLALSASGLNGQSFSFSGYLPKEAERRRGRIKRLERESARKNMTQIFIEAPYRNRVLFNDILAVCNSGTLLCVARDITGEQESIKTDKIGEWKKRKDINILDLPTIYLILAER